MTTILQPNMVAALLLAAKDCLKGEVTAPPRTRALMALHQAAAQAELKPHRHAAVACLQRTPATLATAEACLDAAVVVATANN